MQHKRLFNVMPMAAAISLGAGTATVPNTASAQLLEEVVVTAQKREQSLQDVLPLWFSVAHCPRRVAGVGAQGSEPVP